MNPLHFFCLYVIFAAGFQLSCHASRTVRGIFNETSSSNLQDTRSNDFTTQTMTDTLRCFRRFELELETFSLRASGDIALCFHSQLYIYVCV